MPTKNISNTNSKMVLPQKDKIARYDVEEKEDLGPTRKIVAFRVGKEEYGIGVEETREVINVTSITPIPNSPNYISGVINLRGEIIVIVDLEKKLGSKTVVEQEHPKILVSEVNSKLIGVLVDDVEEVVDLPERNVKDPPQAIADKVGFKYLKGVGIIGKRLIILLNISDLFADEQVGEIESLK